VNEPGRILSYLDLTQWSGPAITALRVVLIRVREERAEGGAAAPAS
jgi:hypothetical protein